MDNSCSWILLHIISPYFIRARFRRLRWIFTIFGSGVLREITEDFMLEYEFLIILVLLFERHTERDISYPLVHIPNPNNSWGWDRTKPGARNSFRVSHVGISDLTTGVITNCLQGSTHYQEAKIWSRARIQTQESGCGHPKHHLNWCKCMTPVIIFFLTRKWRVRRVKKYTWFRILHGPIPINNGEFFYTTEKFPFNFINWHSLRLNFLTNSWQSLLLLVTIWKFS